jgi:nucleoid-associated protein YgaU
MVSRQRPDRRRRNLGAIAALAGAMVLGAGHLGAAHGVAAPVASQRIVVHAGDTLWVLAERHATPGSDPRRWIADVARLNGLTDPTRLLPGQVLQLPAGSR